MPDSSPPLPYHYTNIEGLIGIVQQSKLFATNIFYLNDAQEVEYPASVIEAVVGGLPDLYPETRHAECIKHLMDGLQAHPNLHERFLICVACFCLEGDRLSQWRAYAPSGGFSIGFDSSKLTPEPYGRLSPVIYDRLARTFHEGAVSTG
jgi:hypothetical protein